MRPSSLACVLLPLLLAAAGTVRAGDDGPPSGGAVKENRLAGARSPYLRQHRTNPVDWYPWGDEARARARAEDRPILLSVGYAACHWCHVMEHESFEDEETAALLNATFVCVKVDREERPDVDALTMRAVQVLSGRGGWPTTVVLTPEGEPFFAATYLPRPRLQELARQVGAAWAAHAADIRREAGRIAEHISDLSDGRDLPPFEGSDTDLLRLVDGALAAHYDAHRGGYGAAPKFPPHAELLYLLDRAERDGVTDGLGQVRGTLDAMAAGGLHDQVGGGFHRYATDAVWLLPHFEKMLYDNALLAQAYARAAALTGDARYAAVARDVLAWVVREMACPGGGYASSRDADTQGEEGLTYTWTEEELRRALPPEDADFAVRLFGVRPEGNFHDEATGRLSGRNVLHLAVEPTEAERARLDGIRRRLLAVRDERPQPGLDDKVITAWNGLLLSAFAVCGKALADDALLGRGRDLATFLLASCRRADGTLLRFPRESGEEIAGFCEDHACLADGLLDLADATGEARWAEAAAGLADALLAEFEDPRGGGFYATSEKLHERLLGRRKEAFDSPIPSENAVAARVLLRLGARTGEARYREAAARTLSAWRPLLGWARAARGTVALYRALALRLALAAPDAAPHADLTVEGDPVRVDVFLERAEAAPGGRVRVALRVTLEEGWHVGAPGVPSADRVPASLVAADGAPVRLADVTWPDPAQVPAASGTDGPTLAGTFWVRAVLEVPAGAPPGPRRVPLVLTLQPCNASACLAARETRLDLPLRFAAEDGPANHPGVFAGGPVAASPADGYAAPAPRDARGER